jgi:hypothetical protein
VPLLLAPVLLPLLLLMLLLDNVSIAWPLLPKAVGFRPLLQPAGGYPFCIVSLQRAGTRVLSRSSWQGTRSR